MRGSSPIRVVWYKDGISINSPDYEQKFANNVASLTIEETFSEDTAVYTVQATNDYGTADSSAKLVVKGLLFAHSYYVTLLFVLLFQSFLSFPISCCIILYPISIFNRGVEISMNECLRQMPMNKTGL